MAQPAGCRLPGRSLFRALFVLAAGDSFLGGLWAVVRPGDLFAFLQTPAPREVILWQVLGGLALVHGVVLLILVRQPEAYAPLVLVPLLGRLLEAGIWLWLLHLDRLRLPAGPLRLLLGHAAFWPPVFAGFLLAWGWCRPGERGASAPR
jgi:hypothetical protein